MDSKGNSGAFRIKGSGGAMRDLGGDEWTSGAQKGLLAEEIARKKMHSEKEGSETGELSDRKKGRKEHYLCRAKGTYELCQLGQGMQRNKLVELTGISSKYWPIANFVRSHDRG